MIREGLCVACQIIWLRLRSARPCVLHVRFDLGDKAPQINGIKVYQGDRIEDEVNIEVDVMWSGRQARAPTLGCHEATHRSCSSVVKADSIEARCMTASQGLMLVQEHRGHA